MSTATTTEPRAEHRLAADREALIVVTADSHVGPLTASLRSYCPSEHLDAFDDFIATAAERTAALRRVVAERFGSLTGNVTQPAHDWNAQTAGHHDSAARLADMDHDGVAAEVIFHGSQNRQQIPFQDLGAFITGRPRSAAELEMEAVGRHMYNAWLADFCAEQPARRVGLCQVPIWDLEATVREVEWAHEHGLKGVNFPAPSPSLPSYEDSVWEPFFAVCAERNMVLNTHVGASTDLEPRYTGPGQQSIRFIEDTWLGRRAMWLLTFTGVFDRHPHLKLVITELPGAWFAQAIQEMESSFFNPHTGATVQEFLHRRPSEYAHTNLFMGASYQSREEAVTAVSEGFADRIMWGSDYPHIEGTWRFPEPDEQEPVTRLSMRNTFHGLPEHAVRGMLGENAVDCYGLDRSSLAEVAARVGPTLADFAEPPDLSRVPAGYTGFGFRTRGAYS